MGGGDSGVAVAAPHAELNTSLRAHEMVRKPQRYRFNGLLQGERYDEDFHVQTVDMEGVRCGQQGAAESFAAQLGASLSEIGFAILTGHGIDERLFGGCEAAVGQLFERPLPQKMAHRASRAPGCSVNSGYFPLHETSKLTPDWVEGWVFQRRAFHELAGRGGPRGQHARLQPADGGGVEPGGSFFPPGCEAVERQFTEYIQAMETLPPLVLAAMLRFLGAPVRDGGKVVHPPQLDGAMEVGGCSCAVRMNYYPPLRSDEVAQSPGDEGGGRGGSNGGVVQGRLLGHEDVTMFTLLPAPRGEGLEVLHRRNMRWVKLAAPPGSIILNTGDYMQRISADRLRSTTHRVALPDAPPHGNEGHQTSPRRITFPLNVYLWEDVVLQVLPHLRARGEGGHYSRPLTALEFHTTITTKFYTDEEGYDTGASETAKL